MLTLLDVSTWNMSIITPLQMWMFFRFLSKVMYLQKVIIKLGDGQLNWTLNLLEQTSRLSKNLPLSSTGALLLS